VKRRDFMTLLAGATVWPLAVRAQQPMPLIGFLSGGSAAGYQPIVAAFRQGLAEAGYTEGQNVAIEYRWADGQYDRMPTLAADLVSRKVGVIVATGGIGSAVAAKAASPTIPIVFVTGDDPVKFGLVDSFNRPGGNATGVSFLLPALDAKRVEFLHELLPKATLIAVLVNPSFAAADLRVAAVREAANTLGLQLSMLNADSENDIDNAFASLVEKQAGALIVTSDPFFVSHRDQIVFLAKRAAVPTVYFTREFATAGGLMSYGASISDAYRQTGIYAGKVLKGEKPANLPVMQPTKFELVINLAAARTLGLEIPAKLLTLADEVIE
jgi:putative tryptophan/tyrosine transport system substrate-binding protein